MNAAGVEQVRSGIKEARVGSRVGFICWRKFNGSSATRSADKGHTNKKRDIIPGKGKVFIM